ncbi:MAG: hypothetical protein WD341_02450 [Tistlia sp.]|uniref:hypothetical protein n=1 Tax=Tistlia sp. TaxID=3057121 RepID=UPI0034A565E1
MAKLSTLVAALAILAFTGSAAYAGCDAHDKTAQQTPVQTTTQTAEQPAQTPKPETKTAEVQQ